ncbi:MAG: pilus assembly protein [Elusimicrobia bacterium]|nr:pilus assembly protein [Elusimicrobiota bacterium]
MDKTLNQKGQALLESVLCVPLFVVLLTAFLLHCRVLIIRQQLLMAARYGTDGILFNDWTEGEVAGEIKRFLSGEAAPEIKGRNLDPEKVEVKVKISKSVPPPVFNPPSSWVEVYYRVELPAWMGRGFYISARSEVMKL